VEERKKKLVVIDIMMPGLSGLEVDDHVRSLCPA
jgi:CheY-like chemotaxis protein